MTFSDIDGDEDMDLFLTGQDSSFTPVAKLYINDGNGNYTELEDAPFQGVREGTCLIVDVEGDGDKDIFYNGLDCFGKLSTYLYLNDAMDGPKSEPYRKSAFDFSVYPNPVLSNNTIEVTYASSENGQLTVRLFDVQGRLLHKQKEQMGLGLQRFSVAIPDLPKGTYLLQLEDRIRSGGRKVVVWE